MGYSIEEETLLTFREAEEKVRLEEEEATMRKAIPDLEAEGEAWEPTGSYSGEMSVDCSSCNDMI